MKTLLVPAVLLCLALPARAQNGGEKPKTGPLSGILKLDNSPTEPDTDPGARSCVLAPDHFALVDKEGEDPAFIRLERGGEGPWRFLVKCDETVLDQSDVGQPENGWRRIVHAVLLAETRPEWTDEESSTYRLTIEQMAIDTVRGGLDDMLALPTTDPFRPVPGKDGAGYYQRVIPRVIGTRGEYEVGERGSLESCRFQMGEDADLDAVIGTVMVTRFLQNVSLPLPDDRVGRGGAWTFVSADLIDGHPIFPTRTVTVVEPAGEGHDVRVSQAFTGTVEHPFKAGMMFAGVEGEPKLFGTALEGSGTTQWGARSPIPEKATFVWSEDCTGTFQVPAQGGEPARELSGRSAARWNNEMHAIDGPAGLFVEEGVDDGAAPSAEGGDALNLKNVLAFKRAQEEKAMKERGGAGLEEPTESDVYSPFDLDKVNEHLDRMMMMARMLKKDPLEGKEPLTSWSLRPTQNATQRAEVLVESKSRGYDERGGAVVDTDSYRTRAILAISLSDKKDEDGYFTGTVRFETVEHEGVHSGADGPEHRETLTPEDAEWLKAKSFPLTVSEYGKLWIDATLPGTGAQVDAAREVLSGIEEASVERPYSDQGVGALPIEASGDVQDAAPKFHYLVTERRDKEPALTLAGREWWLLDGATAFKSWGEWAAAKKSQRASSAFRLNVDGEGLVISRRMEMNLVERMRATYDKGGKDVEGEELRCRRVRVRTLE